MKYVLLVVAGLLAGVAGGAVGTYAMLAHAQKHPPELIRAHRFELVNDAEQATSVWGVDEIGYVQLAFGPALDSASRRKLESEADLHALKLKDSYSYIRPRAAIGMYGERGGPFMKFEGSNRELLVLLDLDDFERPGLQMGDGQGMGLTLGSERSDTPEIRDKDEY